MHLSRLSTFVLDCQGDDLDAATRFWSEALGREVMPPDGDSPGYRELEALKDAPGLLVQKVDHPSRVHLDIQADDLEAEVKRLEALGARRVESIKNWWVMEAPTGHRFCVDSGTAVRRPAAFVIDCQGEDVEGAARFWSAALGLAVKAVNVHAPHYRELETRGEGPLLLVQRVGHDSRIHLDIESDDPDAELARLEALGARRVAFVKRWWVVEAPTGQRFCIVRPQRGSLVGRANVWGAPADTAHGP